MHTDKPAEKPAPTVVDKPRLRTQVRAGTPRQVYYNYELKNVLVSSY